MRNKPLYLYLAGGLGNQLFQYSAGLFFHANSKIEYIDCLGHPRKNSNGLPEILSFKLPISIDKSIFNCTGRFLQKLVNVALRLSLSEKKINQTLLKLVIPISSFFVTFAFKRNVRVKTSFGVGFSKDLKVDPGDLLIGYFQSFKWISQKNIFNCMMSLEPQEPSDEFLSFVDYAKKVKPVILHIRLGDYVNENEIGVLERQYYLRALEKLKRKESRREVWIFSDDSQSAKRYFESDEFFEFKYISDFKNSTAYTFQVMRFGSAYVIANSTFSWWSAYLRYDQNAPVYAPTPWFANGKDPLDLIPPNWHVVSRN